MSKAKNKVRRLREVSKNKYNGIQPAIKHRSKTKLDSPKETREGPNLCTSIASVHTFICK